MAHQKRGRNLCPGSDRVYRNNVIARECVDKRSGNLLSRETLKRNHALVLYEVPEDRIMEEI